MKHVKRIIIALALYVGVIYLLGSSHSQEPVSARDPAAVTPTSEQTAAANRSLADQEQLQARQTEERIQDLKSQARHQSLLEAAHQQMPVTRRKVRESITNAWTRLLSANDVLYSSLLDKAKQTSRGQTPCTICDGDSYMPCLLCQNHNGKCTECGGVGHFGSDAYCPACLGKGKCYLCAGSGKMLCPFCDDGMIEVNWPPPSLTPP